MQQHVNSFLATKMSMISFIFTSQSEESKRVHVCIYILIIYIYILDDVCMRNELYREHTRSLTGKKE